VATVEIMGADMAYMGTRFLATVEANIADDYQDMMINSSASDILYTPKILGVNASYMRQSVDFDDELELATQNSSEQKAWRDIWSAGQGVGSIDKVL
jgi:nitronate monooxygenase